MFSQLVSLSLLAISVTLANAQVSIPRGNYTIYSDYAKGYVHSNGGDQNLLNIVPTSGEREIWYIQQAENGDYTFMNQGTHSFAYGTGQGGDPVFSHVNLNTTWRVYGAGDIYYISYPNSLLGWTAMDDSNPRIISLLTQEVTDPAHKWHIRPVK